MLPTVYSTSRVLTHNRRAEDEPLAECDVQGAEVDPPHVPGATLPAQLVRKSAQAGSVDALQLHP